MRVNTRLTVPIAAGATALICALIARFSTLLGVAYPWHLDRGRLDVGAMLAVFVTAIPRSLRHSNLFRSLISIFSLDLALTGGGSLKTDAVHLSSLTRQRQPYGQLHSIRCRLTE